MSRTTNAPPPEGTTVFLAGMRPNQPWRLREWLRVSFEMGKMLLYLRRHPDAGLLWHQLCLARYPFVLTYWASAEALQRFAADARAPHAPAWRWFRRVIGDRGSVGVWHETYVVGVHESVYSGMPEVGLAKAVGSIPLTPALTTFQQRLGSAQFE